MGAAKPPELRDAVVSAFEKRRVGPGKLTHRAALQVVGEQFGIGPASVERFVHLARKLGTTTAKPLHAPSKKLEDADVDALVAWIQETPGSTVYELIQRLERERGIRVHQSTIKRRLAERGMSSRRLKRAKAASQPASPPTTRFTARHRRPKVPKAHRLGYPSDLTDAEWELLTPLLVDAGQPKKYALRDIVDALFYQLRTGCAWRYLPNDLPPYATVYAYYEKWVRSGLFDRLNEALRGQVRRHEGRDEEPTAVVIDSQTAKSAGARAEAGYDGAKKVRGRKRHLVVDTLGLIVALVVHSAAVQDRDGGELVLNAEFAEKHPKVEVVFADGGYQGRFERRINETLPFRVEIVRRNEESAGSHWTGGEVKPEPAPPKSGFQVVRKRWIVERTFGWLVHNRRLTRDYEHTAQSSRSWTLLAGVARMLAFLAA